MLKNLFKKAAKRRDIRFMDIESYKYQKVKKSAMQHKQPEDEQILVEDDAKSYSFDEPEKVSSVSFLELIRQVTTSSNSFEKEQETKTPDRLINTAPEEGKHFLNSLGVFSDSKIYSALIHSALSKYDLDVQHFNHPDTFTQNKYAHFDSISSWIIFLSDEQDCDFLDKFLDRYVDKPTLFLFSKLNKDACMSRIEKFIRQNNLEAYECEQEEFEDEIYLSVLPL